jgi:hypothetical protein
MFQNCAVLDYYAASSRNSVPTFRDNLSVSSSRSLWFLTLKTLPISCPETSIRNYHLYSEERSSHVLRSGRLKLRKICLFHIYKNLFLLFISYLIIRYTFKKSQVVSSDRRKSKSKKWFASCPRVTNCDRITTQWMPLELPKSLKRKRHSLYCVLSINVLQRMYLRGYHWRIIFSIINLFLVNHKHYRPILHFPPSLVEWRAEFAANWSTPCSVSSFKPQREHRLYWRRFTLMSQFL